jgi:sec-independent protein translocase protein TatA
MSIGPWQVAIIALVILLLFGGKRLGSLGKGLGEGIRNFRRGVQGDDDEAKGDGGEDGPKKGDLLKAAGEVAKVGSDLRKATKVSRLLR